MRLRTIRLIFVAIVLLVVLRLGFWQLVKADELSAKAEEQRTQVRDLPAPRGAILFADGSILASTQPTYLLFGQPKLITGQFLKPEDDINSKLPLINSYKKTFAQNLSQALNQNPSPLEATTEAEIKQNTQNLEEGILAKLNKDLFWVDLGKNVDLETKKRLAKLNLVGLGFEPTTSRFYPEGSSSAHLLGFVAKDAYGVDKGYFGVEGFYDGELKGKNGLITQEKDALGLPILIGKFLDKPPKAGKTITLNIDRTIQYIVETKLKQGMEKYGAKEASAVVIDPQTGAVLAMASLPSYDPAHTLYYPKENFKNPITVDSYEPGSTFKTLIMAAALNENVVKPDTVCDICTGPVSLGGFNISTWNNKYNPGENMTEVIIHSDNVGMVFVSRKLGLDKIYDYINRFGIGTPTGLDVQDEFSPYLRDKKDWREIDVATASFGQGISLTPIQLVRAVAAIANGGKLMEPHIAKQIKGDDETFTINPKEISQPISPQTAQSVKEMMVRAVEEGEAKWTKLPGYKMAGKTGTAQIPVAGHYDPNKTIASFVGFGPADNPKFVMLIRYSQPTSSIYGAETAAPTFFSIAKEIFNYYGIAPGEVVNNL